MNSPTLFKSPKILETSALPEDASQPSVTDSRNPLSLRLFKVLGARYDDPSTREALEILSSLYVSATPTSTVDHKRRRSGNQKHSVDTKASDSEEETELKPTATNTASTREKELIISEGAARARKNLRSDMEIKLARTSQMFLAAFSEVNQNLDQLQKQIDAMQVQCDTAQTQIQETNVACKHLLERANVLRLQRQATNAKKDAIASFLSQFTLTEQEDAAVTSPKVAVGPQVFAAIDRCEQIREDCLLLSTIEDGETKAGVEIKALMDSKLESGYEKVFIWVQDEFRQLARDVHTEPSSALREAIRKLRSRPALFNEALGSLSQIRQNTLQSSFIAALTKGGPGGYPRPIELHAHEPTRYVGDMLAWVHQATAGEREFLDGIFGVNSDGRMVGSVRMFDKGAITEEEGYIRELLDSNLEKLCSPLKARIQQTIKSQEGSVTSYKITNILQFYQTTMKRTIGEDALMTETLQEITNMSLKAFFETLRSHGRSMLRFLHSPEADLAPPVALRESCMILREVMQVYSLSLVEDETQEQRIAGFHDVLEGMVQPMLDMCTTMANLMKKPGTSPETDMTAWDRAVFMINCLVYIESVLQPYDFTAEKIKDLTSQMDKNMRIIVEAHFESTIEESGLATLVAAADDPDREMPLSRVAGCSSQNVTASLQSFDNFLSTLDVLTSSHLSLLSLPRLGTQIHRAVLKRVALAYDRLCKAIRDPKNKYEFAGTLLGGRRPFGQIGTLLQVLGLEAIEQETEDYAS
ncbi:Golgi transport complex subunit 6 [Serendipita sp. 401]|nr:Golgi transport complex subunit 6 [Serendipita sp. 401]